MEFHPDQDHTMEGKIPESSNYPESHIITEGAVLVNPVKVDREANSVLLSKETILKLTNIFLLKRLKHLKNQ